MIIGQESVCIGRLNAEGRRRKNTPLDLPRKHISLILFLRSKKGIHAELPASREPFATVR